MRLAAHAKVNLTLEVLGTRPDGYHELRSVVAEIPLHDDVELLDAPNDPKLGEQWYLETLGMDELWDAGYDGEGVTVAVIDSGDAVAEISSHAGTPVMNHPPSAATSRVVSSCSKVSI